MTYQKAKELLDKTTAILSEHFSSVQIVATELCEDGSTHWHCSGSGDWYARKAACEEFIERDQAQTLAQIQKNLNDPEE